MDENHTEITNRNFVQLSRQYLKDWRQLIRVSPLAAEILMFLVEKATTTNNGAQAVVCSYAVLQEVTGYKRSSVASAIKLLKDNKWIQAIKVGTTHAYAINEKVAWRGAANGRQYAIFSATVISAASEQEKGMIEDTTKLKRIPVVRKNETITVSGEDLPPPDQKDLDY